MNTQHSRGHEKTYPLTEGTGLRQVLLYRDAGR